MSENKYLPNINEIRELEKKFDIKLADDYIEFMMYMNGDLSDSKIFHAEGIDEDLSIESMEYFPGSVFEMNDIVYFDHEGKFFLIGSCGGISPFELIINKETGFIEAWDRQGTYCEDEELMEECLDTYKIANNFSEFAKMAFCDEDYEEFISLFEDREYPSDFVDDNQEAFEFLEEKEIIDREEYVWYYDVPTGDMQMVEKDVFRSFMSILSLELTNDTVAAPVIDKQDLIRSLSTKKKKMFSKESYEQKVVELKKTYSLPKLYNDFLEVNNGCLISNTTKSGYYVEKLNRYIYISILFGLFTENKVNDLLYINESNNDIKEAKFFIVGEDLSNGFIVVDLEASNNPVYYWDIANFHRESSYLGNAYLICSSLANFIENIEDGK